MGTKYFIYFRLFSPSGRELNGSILLCAFLKLLPFGANTLKLYDSF